LPSTKSIQYPAQAQIRSYEDKAYYQAAFVQRRDTITLRGQMKEDP
jgi:hypothetical protein